MRLTRRSFVTIGGGLLIGFPADGQNSLDPTLLSSWIEIRPDNTILVRTGRTEIGTGMSAFYAQIVAEELHVRPEAITLIMGDTDKTPDGGYSAGYLAGAANLRKVAAYAYQQWGRLQSAQSFSSSFKIPVSGHLAKMDPSEGTGVAGLDGLTVTGAPPTKPMSQYQVVGKSYPMPGIPDKVTGKTQWSCDLTLPGMLHARMVRPASLGSTLISVGALDQKRFPTARVVSKSNLVAVVSPNEWEAVSAAQAVAAGTKWTDWSGLSGSENLTKTLRDHKWGAPDASRGNAADVTAALAGAPKTISATYEQPYVKHAPIGPFVSVADVRGDGSATVWTHSSNSQGLRARIADTLSTPAEKVVVRWLDHAGQFGRTTFGGDGADADAAILSQLTGKPVRVQWTLQEDLAWSSVVPGWISDVKAGLDANGRLIAVQSAFYSPHMSDARLLGAILAGMPCGTTKPGGWIATAWPYDKIPNRLEQAYGMANIGAESAAGGLRGNIMRTPAQRQQNFALESLINEAAAAAGADPIRFRIDHTTDRRLMDILNATAKAAGWESRPSPGKRGTGRGVAVIVRSNAYWAGIAEVVVSPATGAVRVTKFTVGVECGKIINPRQLERCMKSGVIMGLSEALKEEMTFDHGKVTSTDWTSYKILTMQETPEIRCVQISRDDEGFGTGGEAPNALGPPAVAAAFFDATGVQPRRIPLTPAYVTALLRASPSGAAPGC